MSRPIEARVSAQALRHNYATAKAAAPSARVFAVVKANAYGHGLARVASALGDVDGYATLELEGAEALRAAGPSARILLLEGFFAAEELPRLARASLETAVHCEEQLQALERTALERPLHAWLKLNTGMNRLGFPLGKCGDALTRLQACRSVASVTLMTHFATSDGPPGVAAQVARFEEATRGMRLPSSLCNTAAIFAHPQAHREVVRLGIGLYGATPFADRSAASLGLRPAMTLASELIAIQELAADDVVGYGAGFRAPHPMRIGVVACGYADGYPRHAPTGTPVVVGGVRTRLVGRVSMDMVTVDLTPVPAARVGTPVELWGAAMPVDEVATAAGTVGYELLCAVAPRVPVREVA